MSSFHERIEAVYDYLRSQLAEGSTVNGIASMVTLVGGLKATSLPPEVVMVCTMLVSQSLRIALPDNLPEWLHLPEWPRSEE